MKNPDDETANQTIQVDGIEGLADVQLVDEEAPAPSSRVVPPPLPPGMGLPPPSTRSAPASVAPGSQAAPAPKSRTGLYAVVFLVMVVVAVGGGLTVGAALRGTPPPASASAAPSAAASAPAAPASEAASAEPRVLVLPTIELADVDANAK